MEKDSQKSFVKSVRDSKYTPHSSTNSTIGPLTFEGGPDISPSEGVSNPVSPIVKKEKQTAISPIRKIYVFRNKKTDQDLPSNW